MFLELHIRDTDSANHISLPELPWLYSLIYHLVFCENSHLLSKSSLLLCFHIYFLKVLQLHIFLMQIFVQINISISNSLTVAVYPLNALFNANPRPWLKYHKNESSTCYVSKKEKLVLVFNHRWKMPQPKRDSSVSLFLFLFFSLLLIYQEMLYLSKAGLMASVIP